MNKDKLTLSELQNGDIIKTKYNQISIYLKDIGFVSKDGYTSPTYFKEDLTCDYGDNDIVLVCRPLYRSQCNFNEFDSYNPNIIFERKGVKVETPRKHKLTLEDIAEMTLSEILELVNDGGN